MYHLNDFQNMNNYAIWTNFQESIYLIWKKFIPYLKVSNYEHLYYLNDFSIRTFTSFERFSNTNIFLIWTIFRSENLPHLNDFQIRTFMLFEWFFDKKHLIYLIWTIFKHEHLYYLNDFLIRTFTSFEQFSNMNIYVIWTILR